VGIGNRSFNGSGAAAWASPSSAAAAGSALLLVRMKRRLARETQAAPVFVQLKPVSIPQPGSTTDSSNGGIELHLGTGTAHRAQAGL